MRAQAETNGMSRAELVQEINRLDQIIRDGRRHADDIVELAASAEWDRDMVDPLELRGRCARLQGGLDRVHDRQQKRAA